MVNKKANLLEKIEGKAQKLFLHVIADMRPNAQIMPLTIIWDDGRTFDIEDVFDIKRTILKDFGEQCLTFYCKIGGRRKLIYLDSCYQWFVIRLNSTK